MTLLGRKSAIIDFEEDEKQNQYSLPKVFRQKEEGLTLKKSIVIATLLHPSAVFLVWFTILILALLGIKFTLFSKPEIKAQDIEFVLVQKEQMPINKNTPYRSDRNSRAGGKHDPTRRVSEPSPAPGAPSQEAKQQVQKTQNKPSPQPQQKSAQQPKQQTAPKPEPAKKTNVKENTEAPRFAPKPSAPKPTPNPQSAMQIPIPKTAAPKLATPAGGPITGSSRSGSGSGATGERTAAKPAPSFSPSSGSSSGSGRFSSGQYGNGQAGNPGPGNLKGAPGIDTIKDVDMGPYMREVERRIKANWDPPRGNESKIVVLTFKIARDGRLLNVAVYKSSGAPESDRAAIAAVELSAPFKPLPAGYRGTTAPIQFSFDYNVIRGSIR